MHLVKVISALVVLSGLISCYGGGRDYRPTVTEQPQRVDFFYGTIIAAQDARLRYGNEAGLGLRPGLSPYLAGIHIGAYGSGVGARFSAGFVDVLVEGAVPNVPAVEYTVVLDRNTYPPDPFLQPNQRPAVLVVQNEYPTDTRLSVGTRVFVRVTGGSGRVMAANSLPPFVPGPDTTTIDVAHNLSAGPLPIPLSTPWPPIYAPATDTGYHPQWTIPTF